MEKSKKFFTAMLAVVLLATTMLVGCGENTPVNNTNTPATTTSTTFIYTVDPTDEITVKPTEEITGTPAVEPTEDPAEGSTEELTAEITEEPTEEPTEKPTEKPTEVPTSEPTQTPDTDVTFEDVNETVYAKRNLNVRSGPGTEYDKIGSLKYAKSVKRIGIGSNGWSKVIYNGKTAYCYSKYLSTSKPIDGSYFNIVVGEPGADPDVVNYANQYWNNMVPSWLKQRFVNEGWHMIVSAIPLNIRYNCSGSVAGVTDPAQKTIFLDNRKYAVKRSMIHELGHFIDLVSGWPSGSYEFQLIFQAEKDKFIDCTSIGDGHEIASSAEYFASVCCNIILNNQDCQWQIPRTYAFVVGYMH